MKIFDKNLSFSLAKKSEISEKKTASSVPFYHYMRVKHQDMPKLVYLQPYFEGKFFGLAPPIISPSSGSAFPHKKFWSPLKIMAKCRLLVRAIDSSQKGPKTLVDFYQYYVLIV